MNWIKENKFLSGFLAVTLIVAGVLAFMMTSAMGRAGTAQTNYDTAAAELTRLQTSAPYPDAANLAKMEELKKEHKVSIEELQKDLAMRQIPLTPAVSPAQFQDKLKETVTRVKNAASLANVSLGKDQAAKFYMSFDKYETEPPKPEAAAPLLRMLESMELVVNMLIANNVTEISELKRDLLPEEGGKKEAGKDAAKSSSKDETKALVVRHPFEVSFLAHEGKFHKFINSVVTEKKQFYIPKSITIKNEKEQGPPRVASAAPVPPPAPPAPTTPPDPSAPPSPPAAPTPPAPSADEQPVLIVGEEKLVVTVKIDVIDFAGAPPAKAEAGTPPAKAEK